MSNIKEILKKKSVLVPLVVVFVAVAGFFAIQGTRANSDYICTFYEDVNGDCSDGSYSEWQPVAGTERNISNCVFTRDETRVYTGRQLVSRVIKYFANSRIGCRFGGTHESIGDLTDRYYNETQGQSYGRYAVCRIRGTATKRYDSCGNTPGGTSTTTTASTTPTTTDAIVTILTTSATSTVDTSDISTSTIGTQTELDAQARNRNAHITADPKLVRSGDTSKVSWTTLYMGSCTVTGTSKSGTIVDSGTGWNSIAGNDVQTSPLTEDTTYALHCVDSVAGYNDTFDDEVLIRVLPVPSEH